MRVKEPIAQFAGAIVYGMEQGFIILRLYVIVVHSLRILGMRQYQQDVIVMDVKDIGIVVIGTD